LSGSTPPENLALFFSACAEGDVGALRSLLTTDPSLVRASDPAAHHQGWTGLHAASRSGQREAVRLLLEHGADPNAREAGDNTHPLHWAAAGGHLETVRLLLDAGGDVHGVGDLHESEVIGWAACTIATRGADPAGESRRQVISLLLERGARHHIFSAIAVGDLELIRQLVEHDPQTLKRRMSRFEQQQAPLHFAVSRRRYDILALASEMARKAGRLRASSVDPAASPGCRTGRESTSSTARRGPLTASPLPPAALR
jgi:ankyrin repeat protein